jgi:hypothetical protein
MKRSTRLVAAAAVLGITAAIQFGPAHVSAATPTATVSATAISTAEGTQVAVVKATCTLPTAISKLLACSGTGINLLPSETGTSLSVLHWAKGRVSRYEATLWTALVGPHSTFYRLDLYTGGGNYMSLAVCSPGCSLVAVWSSSDPGTHLSITLKPLVS